MKFSIVMPTLNEAAGVVESVRALQTWRQKGAEVIVVDGGSTDEVIERKLPIAPALMGVYMPNHHWGFLFGAGVELERNEHFFLNRMGVEYAASISRGWEVIGTLSYDIKWKGYDTWILGVGISKILGNHK